MAKSCSAAETVLALIGALDEHVRALGPTIPAATATGLQIGGHPTFTTDVDTEIPHEFSTAITRLVTRGRNHR